MDDRPESTYPCNHCGRQFTRESLDRHEPICRKQAAKKRKVFDSGKQRSAGSDIPLKDVRKVQDEIKKNQGHFKPPKTAWRERHEQFMTSVQSAKGVDYALKTGAPLPPPPKATIPSDYVQCEYCGRHFNQNAAERHIPFCREQHARQGSNSKPPPSGMNQKRNAAPPPRRQPMVASYGNHHDYNRGGGGGMSNGNSRGKTSSALAGNHNFAGHHDPYDYEDEPRNGRAEYRQAGRNTRSISAGRAQHASSNQSRVPVPQRRGVSPVTRIPSYSRK